MFSTKAHDEFAEEREWHCPGHETITGHEKHLGICKMAFTAVLANGMNLNQCSRRTTVKPWCRSDSSTSTFSRKYTQWPCGSNCWHQPLIVMWLVRAQMVITPFRPSEGDSAAAASPPIEKAETPETLEYATILDDEAS